MEGTRDLRARAPRPPSSPRSWWRRLDATEGRQAAATEQDLAAETAIGHMVTARTPPICVLPRHPTPVALQGDVAVAANGADDEIPLTSKLG